MELRIEEDKYALKSIVMLAMIFGFISYEFGKMLLEDLERIDKEIEKPSSD